MPPFNVTASDERHFSVPREHEHDALEQVDVLLVLQQRAMQRPG